MRIGIFWSSEAKLSFNQNLEYLLDEWGVDVVNQFIDRVDEVLERIANDPKTYSIFRDEVNVHHCVINKRIMLIYEIINDSRVDLITFWNTYRDPISLRF